MKAAILIPARYASTRYPGKPLVELALPDGTRKSLIRLTWDAAQKVVGDHAIHVCTDDDRIADHARGFGASVIMTPESCRNGTERCAAAVATGKIDADVIVNLQGDAPLTPPWFVEALIDAMQGGTPVATPVLRCDATTYGHFIEDRKQGRVGGTTAVFGTGGKALYFSKEVIPFVDPGKLDPDNVPVFHHVGVYAYTRDALAAYAELSEGPLERLEGLEQLRFLENGWHVACIEVDGRGRVFWELNNPGDVPRIESVIDQLD
ncbi:3-deoxy-manno-octulosonate cytidylyltransferase [Rhodobacteraceae bacterium THAF1]|uniref:3-deoxy-manno-octulosonate cytidylyltransferase n=1 Tax=Palleronia sp. THAF1 TaxID=2587842 RepID=UPI000F3C13C8|nr:manno-octulosonate cytidylyltransferase [Palleronia sp. THAF1]QFU08928.1 3-deoxy-manno-octulosonate cytidylyltransferase [Palleronia sp. THAF1]VDC24350.1 3-deoxy-manno-octulosonate cytidylyltransferase [Rhodobacteraceae bacterium THAF1]